MPKKYKVLITGSGGMLGIDLCDELDAYHDVYGIDIAQRTAHNVQRFSQVDITDKDKVRGVIAEIKPDVVIHAAAMTDVDGCEIDRDKAHGINTVGTENVAAACSETGSTLIYISTDFVFDGKKKTPYTELDQVSPLSAYGESKLRGEEAVKKYLKKYFILRTSWLYGKNGKNFVDTIIAKAKSGKVLKVVDDQAGSPTYTKDLAKAIGALLGKIMGQNHGTYHVSNAGSVSWYEYAKTILKLAGSETKVIPISSAQLARPAKRPAMSVLDNSKFIKFTDFKMRNWKDALAEYIKGKAR